MELRIWGTRGSFPAPGLDKAGYGGHTPSASVEVSPDEVVVVDAGTGIKDLGDALAARRAGAPKDAPNLRVHLFLTHFHLDHVIGLPFFRPLFSPRCELVIHAPAAPEQTERTLASFMGGALFPLPFAETPALKTFLATGEEGRVGPLRISSCPLLHPQGSVGYRLEAATPKAGPGRAVVFATDTEHPAAGVDRRLAGFAAGAGHLIYDATYTPEEYERSRRGWGHSTWEAGARLAAAAKVARLHLGHLNPDFADDDVDRIVRNAREIFPATSAAYQGLVLEL